MAEPLTVLEKIEKALQEVYAICRGPRGKGHEWRMCIPVEPDDSDVVLAEALNSARDELVTLRKELAEARAKLADLECDEMLARVAADRVTLREQVAGLTRERDAAEVRARRSGDRLAIYEEALAISAAQYNDLKRTAEAAEAQVAQLRQLLGEWWWATSGKHDDFDRYLKLLCDTESALSPAPRPPGDAPPPEREG